MPQAMYSEGATVLPVWPTWYWMSTQPSSTAGREAPTAAPRASARDSMTAKPSGPLQPRPPATTMSASARSTRSEAARATDCTMRARSAASTGAATTSAVREASASGTGSAFGRTVATTVGAAAVARSITLAV